MSFFQWLKQSQSIFRPLEAKELGLRVDETLPLEETPSKLTPNASTFIPGYQKTLDAQALRKEVLRIISTPDVGKKSRPKP